MTETSTAPAPTPEQKQAAAAAIVSFLDKFMEHVITKTTHVFLQPDGLHIVFYNGEKIAYILNGKLYVFARLAIGTPARDQNAFITATIETLRKVYKITGEELPEGDFYYDYMLHVQEISPVMQAEADALVDSLINDPSDLLDTVEKEKDPLADEKFQEFLEWKNRTLNTPEAKEFIATGKTPEDLATEKKIPKAPPIPPVKVPEAKASAPVKRPARKTAKKSSRKK